MSSVLRRQNLSVNSVRLPLGKNVFNGGVTFYVERLGFGVTVVAAVSRYGKSTLVGNLVTEVGRFRPIITLDYMGEHENRAFPNFLTKDFNINCLPGLVCLRDVRFRLSDFNRAADWAALGFSERASQVAAELAKSGLHKNNIDVFNDMIRSLPTNYAEEGLFNDKFGLFIKRINHTIYESLNTQWWLLKDDGFFVEEEVVDWRSLLLSGHHVNINFNLDRGDVHKARAIAGKVLEKIKAFLPYMRVPPMLVLEEADVIAPSSSSSLFEPTSVRILKEFVLKLQKLGVELVFIVQDLERIDPTVRANFHKLILGRLPPNNTNSWYLEMTARLQWSVEANYREFLLLDNTTNQREVFTPLDSSTLY